MQVGQRSLIGLCPEDCEAGACLFLFTSKVQLQVAMDVFIRFQIAPFQLEHCAFFLMFLGAVLRSRCNMFRRDSCLGGREHQPIEWMPFGLIPVWRIPLVPRSETGLGFQPFLAQRPKIPR